MPFLVFACAFALLLRRLVDPDIWTHLTIGREVVRLGGVPPTEFYVAPLLGQPGHFNEWGFGLLYYLAHQAGGVTAMVVLNAALAALLFLCLFAILRRRAGGQDWAALTLVLGALWIAEFRLSYRPEMMLYLAAFTTLYGLERFEADGRRRWLLVLPAACFLLAQFHPSVLIVLIFAGGKLLDSLRQPEGRQRAPWLLTAMLGAGALACVNPYGADQVLLPLRFVFDQPLLSGITELLPALETEVASRFVVAGLVGATAFAVLRRRTRISDALLFLCFALLAYRHARNVALFGLIAVLPAASALAALRLPKRWAAVLPAAAFLGAGVPLVADADWGPGIDERVTPLRAPQQLIRSHERGTVLGFFHLGNYLAWSLYPQQRVIADARNFSYTASLDLHDRLFRADPGWEQLLRQSGVVAVVTPMTLGYSGEFIPLATRLLTSPDWVLAVREPAGLTFVRADGHAPAPLPPAEAWDQAAAELSHNLTIYPDSVESRKNLEISIRNREALRP